MAFGSPLRSTGTDYVNSIDIAVLRREMDAIITELFSRDDSIRIAGLRSLNSLGGLSQSEQLEALRRQNLVVTIMNSRVTPNMLYAEVYPKYNDYGQIPRELERGRRMEEFLNMDSSSLDHILQQYNLPHDRRPDYLLSNSLLSNAVLGGRERLGSGLMNRAGLLDRDRLGDRYGLDRQHKLIILFEWLGVDLSHERFGGVSGRLGLDGRLGGGDLLSGSIGGGLLSGGLNGRRGIGGI